MKVILSCSECDFQAWGSAEGRLMNKIVMWNHAKRAHADQADLVMQTYEEQAQPSDIYETRRIIPITA
ncbi:MAG TPA: hypothetical protein VHD55_01340 [Candidatus Paceibacterota bacterium]|nr:hypothetical protein [Candidatus Paceibacterota bacterium]